MPPVPTLRVATPVFTPGGQPFGIFIINVDMRPAFDRVRASARAGENVYLIDEAGDYLIHPDRAREFGSHAGQADRLATRLPVRRRLARRDAKALRGSCRIRADVPAASR